MLLQAEATLLGDGALSLLDLRIAELLDMTAIEADQMIVMLPGIEFVD